MRGTLPEYTLYIDEYLSWVPNTLAATYSDVVLKTQQLVVELQHYKNTFDHLTHVQDFH